MWNLLEVLLILLSFSVVLLPLLFPWRKCILSFVVKSFFFYSRYVHQLLGHALNFIWHMQICTYCVLKYILVSKKKHVSSSHLFTFAKRWKICFISLQKKSYVFCLVSFGLWDLICMIYDKTNLLEPFYVFLSHFLLKTSYFWVKSLMKLVFENFLHNFENVS